jgi:hypothetical protein
MTARSCLRLVNAALAVVVALSALALFAPAAVALAIELTRPSADRTAEAIRTARLDAIRAETWDRLCEHGHVPAWQDGYTPPRRADSGVAR